MTDKDELLRLAQDVESFLLEFETEMRAAGLTPDERHTDQPPPPPHKLPHRPMEDRLGGGSRDVRDRLGSRVPPTQDNRECNQCKQIGHIARLCPNLPRTSLQPTPLPRMENARVDGLAAHKTDGAVCTACKKPGHVEAQCWQTHPELLSADLLKKRQSAMSVGNRKRRKAAEYTSPGYLFQGMALTYNRTLPVMMQRRSTRAPQPTRQAIESIEQRPARRV